MKMIGSAISDPVGMLVFGQNEGHARAEDFADEEEALFCVMVSRAE
jgi:hypothetical protein